jgi:hypothetical protein
VRRLVEVAGKDGRGIEQLQADGLAR